MWDKLDGRPPFDSYSDAELAWCSVRGKVTILRYLWKGLACSKRGEDNGRRIHPMQKPVQIMAAAIAACQLPAGALILDPFMGAGSTAVAAFGLRMRFVGVEIEPRWFDAAAERIRTRCDAGMFDL